MIKITFNKYIELLFGLQYCVFKSENNIYGLDSNYFRDSIPSYCQDFYELYQKNISKDFIIYIKNGGLDTYNRTLDIALSINENYEISYNEKIKRIEENNPNFSFSQLKIFLKDFTNNANYEQFYASHKEIHNLVIKKFNEALNKYIVFDNKILTDFYGYSIGKLEIVLTNFINGSFGYDNLAICQIKNISDKENDLKISSRIINVCFHEFSHLYLNPLGQEYFQNIDLSNVFNEALKNGLQNCYNNWITLINEYMVRAVQIFLDIDIMEKDYIKQLILNHQKIGYIHIEEIINLLKNKNNYNNFKEFYKKEIVNYFIKLNNRLAESKF